MYNKLIKKLTGGLVIYNKEENDEFIYIFFKAGSNDKDKTKKTYKDEAFADSNPLIINKKTGEYKFINISELLSPKYFDEKIFTSAIPLLNEDVIISKILEKEYINPDYFFDIAKVYGHKGVVIRNENSNLDIVIIESDNEEIHDCFLKFLEKIKASFKVLDEFSIEVILKLNGHSGSD